MSSAVAWMKSIVWTQFLAAFSRAAASISGSGSTAVTRSNRPAS